MILLNCEELDSWFFAFLDVYSQIAVIESGPS